MIRILVFVAKFDGKLRVNFFRKNGDFDTDSSILIFSKRKIRMT